MIGVFFGTSSGRAVLVRVSDGEQPGSAVRDHRRGVMVELMKAVDGQHVLADWALQGPGNYRNVLQARGAFDHRRGRGGPLKAADRTDFPPCTVGPWNADATPLRYDAHAHGHTRLHDRFGRGGKDVMRPLKAIRPKVRAAATGIKREAKQ